MKKRLFPLLITLAALLVSGSAAFYSVFGLSKLFAGAATQVIIMAGSLEFAKLVVASLLYQYWDTINKWLRSYLAIACFVLMVITSGGIYGFLSGAYQSTATQSELLDKSLLILEQKQVRFEETKDDLTIEKTQINKSISDLRVSLSNPHQVSWYDKNSETVITSSSSSARRALQAELDNTKSERINLNLKLEAVVDSINKTDMALLNKEISNEAESELGPLKYLASTTGWPMDKVVNYFLLLIVFVFDPLAIALVVAANMAFTQIRKPEEIVIEEQKEDNTTQPSESLKQRVKENQNKLRKPIDPNPTVPVEEQSPEEITVDGGKIEVTVEPTKEQIEELEDERRMDIIGQNGNDGLHYEDEESKPVQPTKKELDILQNHLNRLTQNTDELYYNENYLGDLYRLTDTTQTLIVDKEEDKKNEKRTLTYRKRK